MQTIDNYRFNFDFYTNIALNNLYQKVMIFTFWDLALLMSKTRVLLIPMTGKPTNNNPFK